MAVYIGALQRHQQAPKIQDVINLNKVSKWIKRKACVIRFKKLVPPLKILAISELGFQEGVGRQHGVQGTLTGVGGNEIRHARR